jgi:hypothetical protein
MVHYCLHGIVVLFRTIHSLRATYRSSAKLTVWRLPVCRRNDFILRGEWHRHENKTSLVVHQTDTGSLHASWCSLIFRLSVTASPWFGSVRQPAKGQSAGVSLTSAVCGGITAASQAGWTRTHKFDNIRTLYSDSSMRRTETLERTSKSPWYHHHHSGTSGWLSSRFWAVQFLGGSS